MAKIFPDDAIEQLTRERYESTQSSTIDEDEAQGVASDETTAPGRMSLADPNSYAGMRNELKAKIVKEVMKEVLPDIGAYNIDGIVTATPVRKGRIINILKYFGLYPLTIHETIMAGQIKAIQKFMEEINTGKTPNPMLVNQYDEAGRTPLSLAVKIKREDIVVTLIEFKALPDICDEETGRSPLLYSVLQRTVGISMQLIAAGASVNLVDKDCVSPLMLAGENNDFHHARILCEQLADVDAQVNRDEYDVCFECAVMTCLVHVQDDNGWTPLHYAANGNSPKVMLILLEYGAHRNIRDMKGRKVTSFYLCNN